MYDQYASGKTSDILDLFEDEKIINYLSGIMAEDFGIIDINKCIEDLLSIYNKEKLINYRNNLLKQLENTEGKSAEEVRNLEVKLNEVILKLAKIK